MASQKACIHTCIYITHSGIYVYRHNIIVVTHKETDIHVYNTHMYNVAQVEHFVGVIIIRVYYFLQ